MVRGSRERGDGKGRLVEMPASGWSDGIDCHSDWHNKSFCWERPLRTGNTGKINHHTHNARRGLLGACRLNEAASQGRNNAATANALPNNSALIGISAVEYIT
jgi:hypothetical protein